MAKFTLTPDSLEKIMTGVACEKPVVQVLGHKKIMGAAQGPERYRLLLSDGTHSVSSAMLATQLNDKVTSGQIDVNAVVRLDKYICNVIQADKRVIVVLELSVMGVSSIVGGKIGNPQPYKQPSGDQSNNSDSKPQQPLQQQQQSNFSNNSTMKNVLQNNVNNGNNSSTNKMTLQQPKTQNSSISQQINKNNSSSMDTPSKIFPISALSPYLNRWTIKVRVIQKSSIRKWSNSKGEGQLFSMNLIDQSGEIRATLFKNEVDKFYNMIEINKVYLIRKAQLKLANKQYSNLNNDFEITFTGETEVIPCNDDDDEDGDGHPLPTISFNFVGIDKFEQTDPNIVVDVIGVLKECGEIKTLITRQSSKEIKKRDIVLVDQSQVQIKLTLWSDDAEKFEGEGHPVVAVKGCRVSDWGGRSLCQASNSLLLMNPDIPECHALRGWFDNVGCNVDYMEYKKEGSSQGSGVSNWKTFDEVKAQTLDPERADYFTNKATVTTIKKENCLYKACPQPECNKKVIDDGNSSYRCEKCAKEFNTFKWRLLLQMNLCDFTDNHWVTCFQDTAETILGMKAEEIGMLRESDPAEYDQIFTNANFSSFIFKMRSKVEKYNDESRLKTVCLQASPINFVELNNRLITELEMDLGRL